MAHMKPELLNGREYVHPADCFACGSESRHSLGMLIEPRHHAAVARCSIPDGMHGVSGIVHGGVVVAILDEAMGAVTGFGQYARMTRSLDTVFHRPAKTATPLVATSRVLEIRRRSFSAHAELRHAGDATLLAEATAVFVLVDLNASPRDDSP